MGAFLILLWASGCSLFSGVYLHDDSYQQKADSAQSDFNKIDLASKFNDQFTKVTSYDNDEDKAVAQLQTASRNRQLQDFIQLPGWYQACSDDENHQVPCSGAPGLSYEVHRTLVRLTGYRTLNASQREGLHKALFLAPADADALKAIRKTLTDDLSDFATAGGQAPPNPCPRVAPQTPWPTHCDAPDADCFWKRVQSDCGNIARYSRSQRLLGLNPWLGGELRTLVNTRDAAVEQRKNDQTEADTLTQQIKKVTSSNTKSDKSDASSGELSTTVDQIQRKLNNNSFPAVAKYLGLTGLANQLQSLLSDQLSQNTPQPKSSAEKPEPTSSPKSNQVQALINLATSAKTLTDDYAGKGPHDRVNALLLATAAARHQADMAKLDADYQADVITIYNAEIDTRLRQAVHLDEANVALLGNIRRARFRLAATALTKTDGCPGGMVSLARRRRNPIPGPRGKGSSTIARTECEERAGVCSRLRKRYQAAPRRAGCLRQGWHNYSDDRSSLGFRRSNNFDIEKIGIHYADHGSATPLLNTGRICARARFGRKRMCRSVRRS